MGCASCQQDLRERHTNPATLAHQPSVLVLMALLRPGHVQLILKQEIPRTSVVLLIRMIVLGIMTPPVIPRPRSMIAAPLLRGPFDQRGSIDLPHIITTTKAATMAQKTTISSATLNVNMMLRIPHHRNRRHSF